MMKFDAEDFADKFNRHRGNKLMKRKFHVEEREGQWVIIATLKGEQTVWMK